MAGWVTPKTVEFTGNKAVERTHIMQRRKKWRLVSKCENMFSRAKPSLFKPFVYVPPVAKLRELKPVIDLIDAMTEQHAFLYNDTGNDEDMKPFITFEKTVQALNMLRRILLKTTSFEDYLSKQPRMSPSFIKKFGKPSAYHHVAPELEAWYGRLIDATDGIKNYNFKRHVQAAIVEAFFPSDRSVALQWLGGGASQPRRRAVERQRKKSKSRSRSRKSTRRSKSRTKVSRKKMYV